MRIRSDSLFNFPVERVGYFNWVAFDVDAFLQALIERGNYYVGNRIIGNNSATNVYCMIEDIVP